MFRNWIRSNILFVGDIVGVNGFLRNNELKQKLVNKDGRWLSEYARLRSALKPQWVECLNTNRQKDICTSRNCESYQQALSYSKVFLIKHEVAIDFVKLKQIYAELIKLKQNSSRAMQFWNEVLHPETSMKWRSLWLYRLKYVRDNSLIQFNFKFMYNILPIPTNLFKWKLKETDLMYSLWPKRWFNSCIFQVSCNKLILEQFRNIDTWDLP